LNAANVDIIDPPALPTEPVEPKIPLVLALSMILGSGAGIVLAFVAENLDSVIRNPEEIEILTGIPLVGIVPHVKSARVKGPRQNGELETERPRQNALICLLRPNSQASEAFRTLRTSLLLASAGTPPRTILVSSAIPGEGKSFTSMNIASVLTQLGARVLLVDADMRRGLVAERLNLAKNFGLSGSLTGAGNWRDAVASLPEEANLFVLQAGAHPPNSAELVASTQMHALIEEWREEYDHVVIDTPPVLIVTDAVLMAQKADAVILVSRIAVTSRQGLRRASELLQSGNARVTGIVANDAGAAESYYGYGYGKYTGYYSEDSV
jgi:capsular exopolysaccharide synthesis family protein